MRSGAEDLLGQLAALCGGMCFRARGAGGQRAIDEQMELAGGMRRPRVAEPAKFVFEELLDALAEEVTVAGEQATIRWRYRFGTGPADSVRGVNLMRVRDGLIVEALGYSKTPGEVPLAADPPPGA